MPNPDENHKPLSLEAMAQRFLDLFENRLIPSLERIATTLEQRPSQEMSLSSQEILDLKLQADTLKKKIEAAREANDLGGVLDLRSQLEALQHQEDLAEFDRPLAQWLLTTVHKRIRSGRISLDVVVLAGRVAEQFGTTKEGATLRASLPTLRRSVGLCAKCGDTYKGIEDACPKCSGGSFGTDLPTIEDLPKDDPVETPEEVPPPFHEFD